LIAVCVAMEALLPMSKNVCENGRMPAAPRAQIAVRLAI
jgi:hypothetical protein